MTTKNSAEKPALSTLLIDVAAMAEADRITIREGCPGILLMERAGRGVADVVMRFLPAPAKVLVVCGPGNNGGDGFVIARVLEENGYIVQVVLSGERSALRGDAATAAAAWGGKLSPIQEACPFEADIIVDALFGAGLSRALEGAAEQLVLKINEARKPVIAVDIPSGVSGDTGQVAGAAIRATRTVTFAARKPGHLLFPGAQLAGELDVVDIGIEEASIRAVHQGCFANGPDLWRSVFPRLTRDAHKYRRGHTLVLSGGATRTGAARLAARAALRTGAGLVTVAAPPEALPVHAAHLTAIMLRGMEGANGLRTVLADQRLNTIVLGPALGIGAMTRAMVAVALSERRSTVIDADAITSFSGMADDLAVLTRATPVVMTPHDGEFERLFSDKPSVVNLESKIEKARYAALFLGCVVVLKGPDTIIAAPDGRIAINENGTPLLATAGTGDVLAGMIGGLMSQGMPAFDAACAAVWLHALAAGLFGPGLIAEDIPEMLPRVLQNLASGYLEPGP